MNSKKKLYVKNYHEKNDQNLKSCDWYCTYKFQAYLVLKKPLAPGIAIGRNTGKIGCEMGIELGMIKGCGTFAIIGGFMHSCSA